MVAFVEYSSKIISEYFQDWRYNNAISLLTCTRIRVVQIDEASHSIACIATLSHEVARVVQRYTVWPFFTFIIL